MLSVGMIVAMREEFDPIRGELIPDSTVSCLDYSQVASGLRDGIQYTVLQAGIGTTNAAIGTCDLLHRFQPDLIVNIGTTALIKDPSGQIAIGDVLVPEEHYQWDLDLGGPITPEWGAKRSLVDVLKVNVLRPAEWLLATAERHLPQRVRVVQFSGNSFFCDDAQHELLPSSQRAVAVDMESFAVAQVCARKGVPFISLRGVTDTGSETANEDFYDNVHLASRNAAAIAHRLLLEIETQ